MSGAIKHVEWLGSAVAAIVLATASLAHAEPKCVAPNQDLVFVLGTGPNVVRVHLAGQDYRLRLDPDPDVHGHQSHLELQLATPRQPSKNMFATGQHGLQAYMFNGQAFTPGGNDPFGRERTVLAANGALSVRVAVKDVRVRPVPKMVGYDPEGAEFERLVIHVDQVCRKG